MKFWKKNYKYITGGIVVILIIIAFNIPNKTIEYIPPYEKIPPTIPKNIPPTIPKKTTDKKTPYDLITDYQNTQLPNTGTNIISEYIFRPISNFVSGIYNNIFSPNLALGAGVVYDSSDIGLNYNVISTGQLSVRVPRVGTPTYNVTTELSFYTFDGSETILRVKRISGLACTAVSYSDIAFYINPWVSPNLYAPNTGTSGTATGDYCEFNISNIPSGANINSVQIAPGSAFTLDGNSTNTGYSTDSSFANYGVSGGFAFQICVDSCTGGFNTPTPPNSITANFPIENAVSIDANVTFQGNYVNDGEFDSIAIFASNLDTTPLATEFNFFCDNALITETGTFNCQRLLELNTNYAWSAVMYNSADTFPYTGSPITDTRLFSTGNIAGGIIGSPNSCSPFDFFCEFQRIFSFLQGLITGIISALVSAVQSFFPFSLIGDLNDIIQTAYSNKTTSSLGEVDIAVMGTTMNIFTMQGVQDLMGTTATNTISGILSILLYTGFALMAYKRLTGLHFRS